MANSVQFLVADSMRIDEQGSGVRNQGQGEVGSMGSRRFHRFILSDRMNLEFGSYLEISP